MGGIDKVFTPLSSMPVLAYSLRAFSQVDAIRELVVVVGPGEVKRARSLVDELTLTIPCICVAGGERRQDSVLAGLSALADCTWVAIHDAARPLVTPALIAAGLEAALKTGAAIPGIPVTDTIKFIDASARVTGTPDRSSLRAVQTPQVFRLAMLLDAYAANKETVTDDAALIEQAGGEVIVYPGDPDNIKVTYKRDLALAEQLLRERLS